MEYKVYYYDELIGAARTLEGARDVAWRYYCATGAMELIIVGDGVEFVA